MSDHEVLLSNFTGKVVLIEFLLTNCQRCLDAAQMINSLYRDLGPRGFQPLGVSFENNMNGFLASNFGQNARLAYPVYYTSSGNVDAYLGRASNERFGVPQIVVIDRHGVVRVQSQPIGEPLWQNETNLRQLLNTLLKEGEPSWTSSIFGISSIVGLLILACIAGWRWKQHRQLPSPLQSK